MTLGAVDSLTRSSGIYCIKNIFSGRIYVGSAVNIRARWIVHKCLLGKNKHHSIKLQRSWNKHGKDAFIFEILEFVDDKSSLVDREQYWIDALHAACPKLGLNCRPLAATSLGVKLSPETRAKMSAARIGKKRVFVSCIQRQPRGPMSESARKKISLANRGRKMPQRSADHIAKLVASLVKGRAAQRARDAAIAIPTN